MRGKGPALEAEQTGAVQEGRIDSPFGHYIRALARTFRRRGDSAAIIVTSRVMSLRKWYLLPDRLYAIHYSRG